MSRDASSQAKQTFNEDQSVYNKNSAQQQGLIDQLTPIYTQEATNPQGFSQSDLNTMKTGSEQATGGAVAGAASQGDLRAARTRNSGGSDVALGESVRDAMRTNSDNELAVNNENAKLKLGEQQAGIEGLAGLEGQSNSDVLSSLGLSNQSTQALTDAGKSGWFQNFIATINALKPGGSAGGGKDASISFGG